MSRLLAEIELMMLEMKVDAHERQRAAVLADPVKHKLTLHFPSGARMNYRYCPVDKAGWPRVIYCYATERNLAGYFLGLRETIKRDGSGKRDQWTASKRRNTVRDKAIARAKAHNERVRPKPRKSLEDRRATYWISEQAAIPQGMTTRGLGKIVTTGGPNNALDLARIKWPNATGDLVATHMGRK